MYRVAYHSFVDKGTHVEDDVVAAERVLDDIERNFG